MSSLDLELDGDVNDLETELLQGQWRPPGCCQDADGTRRGDQDATDGQGGARGGQTDRWIHRLNASHAASSRSSVTRSTGCQK